MLLLLALTVTSFATSTAHEPQVVEAGSVDVVPFPGHNLIVETAAAHDVEIHMDQIPESALLLLPK